MKQILEIEGLRCFCASSGRKDRITYILYPMDLLDGWAEAGAAKYGTDIVVVTGMDWQNVFSPWPAKGVPAGTEDFEGKSPQFLALLQQKVIPQVETALGTDRDVPRTLVGVSMSGLFALWQWLLCDTFFNIASLSGSFWYEGFIPWMQGLKIPRRQGEAFFLLGDREAQSKVFGTVAEDTREAIRLLDAADIRTCFKSVPGNHYSDPIPRLDDAMSCLEPVRQ